MVCVRVMHVWCYGGVVLVGLGWPDGPMLQGAFMQAGAVGVAQCIQLLWRTVPAMKSTISWWEKQPTCPTSRGPSACPSLPGVLPPIVRFTCCPPQLDLKTCKQDGASWSSEHVTLFSLLMVAIGPNKRPDLPSQYCLEIRELPWNLSYPHLTPFRAYLHIIHVCRWYAMLPDDRAPAN